MFDLHIRDILRLQNIERWAIVETTKSQSVAEHSYNVAMIAESVFEEARRNGFLTTDYDRYKTMQCCLFHDLAEIFTGDIPTPVKSWIRRRTPVDPFEGIDNAVTPNVAVNDLMGMCQNVVKFADLLEAVVFIEKYQSNHHGQVVHLELREKLAEMLKGINEDKSNPRELVDAMITVWQTAEHAEYTMWRMA